jgi:hypothetical protein
MRAIMFERQNPTRPLIAARTRMAVALQRMELALSNGRATAEITQLASLFVVEARRYAAQASTSAPVGMWEIPADCANPSLCSAQGACLYTPCSARNSNSENQNA